MFCGRNSLTARSVAGIVACISDQPTNVLISGFPVMCATVGSLKFQCFKQSVTEYYQILLNIIHHHQTNRINEKKRDEGHASPDADLALTLSTVFGLNHYPNYLYRFREESEELSKMESLLQQELEKVQKQTHKLEKLVRDA